MYNRITPETRQAMGELSKAGVTTVKVSFSGGNDEGGADGFNYFDAAGNKVEGMSTAVAYEYSEWNSDTRSYGPDVWKIYDTSVKGHRDATPEEVEWAKVAKVLEAPIYDRFGSFAGEFYVHGEVTWDVAAGTHKMTGQEQVSHWEDL